MKADRLLSILLLLQAHGRMTGRELSERLEVSERTLHRDMDALSASGVPIYALRGVKGGWCLDDGWRTQVPGLDPAELKAFLMAQPRIVGDARLAAAAERALNKLVASFPVGMREQATSIRRKLYVDTTAWRSNGEDLSQLPIVQDAVSNDRKLSFVYKKSGGEVSERVVDPLGLVAKGNTWYLVARAEEKLRSYRVSRIERAELLDQPCERPMDFDLAYYWKTSAKAFQEEWYRYEVTLLAEPRAARWIQTWESCQQLPSKAGETSPWIKLKVGFTHDKEACFSLLGLGANVFVLEPDSLREQIRLEAEKILKSFEKHS